MCDGGRGIECANLLVVVVVVSLVDGVLRKGRFMIVEERDDEGKMDEMIRRFGVLGEGDGDDDESLLM